MRELISKIRVWGLAGIFGFFRRKYAFFVQRRRLARLVRHSATTVPQRGITVVGDLTGRVSLSKALRDFILCLKDAGIPFQAYDTLLKPQIPESDVKGIVTPIAEFDPLRYTHVVMMYRCPLEKEWMPKQVFARIAFAIIAMSDFNYSYYKRAFSDQPVYKILYPFRPKLTVAPPPENLRERLGIAKDDFVVFFNFDFGSYYRKNITAELKAFALAFKGDKKAKLVFKTKGADANRHQVAEMMALVGELGIGEQFVHIPQYLSRADLDGLTAACDVYLSLHRAEGFGLGMAEAMSQGKPVVATNWSANTEFCRPDTAWCIPYRIVPVLPHEYMVATKEWAEADVEAAAAALREIRNDPKSAALRASSGAVFMREHFSLASFKNYIEMFLDGTKGGRE